MSTEDGSIMAAGMFNTPRAIEVAVKIGIKGFVPG